MVNISLLQIKQVNSKIFFASLAQGNLANKSDIADLVKKTNFDDKLKNLNKNVTSHKIKHVLVENELNELSKKV